MGFLCKNCANGNLKLIKKDFQFISTVSIPVKKDKTAEGTDYYMNMTYELMRVNIYKCDYCSVTHFDVRDAEMVLPINTRDGG